MRIFIGPDNATPPEQYVKLPLDIVATLPQDTIRECIAFHALETSDKPLEILTTLKQKLAIDGTLQIDGHNLASICRGYIYGQLNLEQTRQLLYANKTCYGLNEILHMCHVLDLHVVSQMVSDYSFSIKVTKHVK